MKQATSFDPDHVLLALKPGGRAGGLGTVDLFHAAGATITAMSVDEIEVLKSDPVYGPVLEAMLATRAAFE